jgi:hypothetical protein
LIDAYRQLISRAHANGVKVIGATITPFEGVDISGYSSESKEAVRQAETDGSGPADHLMVCSILTRFCAIRIIPADCWLVSHCQTIFTLTMLAIRPWPTRSILLSSGSQEVRVSF